jgi:uncharacterized protein with GYD domain
MLDLPVRTGSAPVNNGPSGTFAARSHRTTFASRELNTHQHQEASMALYLTRARYSQEAYKGMIAKPENREAMARMLFEASGMKLQHVWYSPNTYEIIVVGEGDSVSGTTAAMVVLASGGFTDVQSIELLSMQQQFDAMKAGAAVAAKFRPPGK